ncbi:MAG: heme exporter protein CcmD [Burkholderiales bacterium]|nr:heme exporter protein CcmD [Burkholderiales bacterium]MDE2394862.1 heme exporter protein CcmD [Burkholderiales bacterium]MDE2452805.1 heme exporter protein CcmD [Burkholderiales bacterium]
MLYWKSWDDFFHMGGYALYVWGAYGLTALVMAAEALGVAKRRRRALAAAREGSQP